MSVSLLPFYLDNNRYALPAECALRVLPAMEMTALPGAPSIVMGIIALSTQIIPVFNIRSRFRLREKSLDIHDQYIIAKTTRRVIALIVDRTEPVTTHDGIIEPIQSIASGTGYIQGIARFPDGLVLIQDLERFLSFTEEQQLDVSLSKLYNQQQ